jgi:DNA invertase Pin-like site-specific DNA recombinase
MPIVMADGYKKDEIYIIKHKESATKNNFEQRQSVQELMDLIEHNPIEILYTSEVSRLARRSDVMYGILKVVTEKNICIYIQKPQPIRSINIDGTPNPTFTIMFAFLQSVAESESVIKLERLKSGLRQRRAEGRVTGRIKFGYDRTFDNKPIPNAEKAKAIRDIFDMYLTNHTIGEIWRKYQYTGLLGELSRSSGEGRIKKILHDPAYIGEHPIFQYQPIVSKEIWNATQERFKSRDKKKMMTKVIYLCQGLIKCKGKAMTPRYDKKQYELVDKNIGKKYCVNVNVMDSLAKEASCGVSSVLDGKDIRQRLKSLSESLKMANLRVSKCDSTLKSLDRQRKRVNDMYQKDKIEEYEWNKRLQGIDEESDRCQTIKKEQLNNIASFTSAKEQLMQKLVNNNRRLEDKPYLDITDPIEERELVRKCIKIIDVIPLSKGNYKIVIYYQDPSFNSDVWYHYTARGWKITLQYVCDEIVREMEWKKRI